LQFTRGARGWKQGVYKPVAIEKRPDQEGPIPKAIAARHIYVYGTGGSPTEDELNQRREIAARAAEWGSPRMRLLTTFRVLSASEARPSDFEAASMILFGTKETNTLIQQMAGRLPLELNAGAADYGLVYVCPNGNHYVVINSGLPWWSGIERMRQSTFGYLPPSYSILTGMQDYMLFRGTVEHVVASGHFDRNWRLPREAVDTITRTGAVKLIHLDAVLRRVCTPRLYLICTTVVHSSPQRSERFEERIGPRSMSGSQLIGCTPRA
jgi:hypothetical protein